MNIYTTLLRIPSIVYDHTCYFSVHLSESLFDVEFLHPCQSFLPSGDDINIRPTSFDHGSRFKIYQIGSSLASTIFPFINQVRTVFNSMSVIPTMCTPRSSWKWEVSFQVSFLITIVAMNWSSFSNSSTSTSVTPSRSLRSFIDLECRPTQSICKCIQISDTDWCYERVNHRITIHGIQHRCILM
jgi:hypothetical protein